MPLLLQTPSSLELLGLHGASNNRASAAHLMTGSRRQLTAVLGGWGGPSLPGIPRPRDGPGMLRVTELWRDEGWMPARMKDGWKPAEAEMLHSATVAFLPAGEGPRPKRSFPQGAGRKGPAIDSQSPEWRRDRISWDLPPPHFFIFKALTCGIWKFPG